MNRRSSSVTGSSGDPARDRLRVTLGEGLGGNLAEDQDPEGHQTDRNCQSTVLGIAVGDLGGQCGSEDVDQVVADQDRDQEVLGGGGPTVEPGPR
jgi:hypothetical protein